MKSNKMSNQIFSKEVQLKLFVITYMNKYNLKQEIFLNLKISLLFSNKDQQKKHNKLKMIQKKKKMN